MKHLDKIGIFTLVVLLYWFILGPIMKSEICIQKCKVDCKIVHWDSSEYIYPIGPCYCNVGNGNGDWKKLEDCNTK